MVAEWHSGSAAEDGSQNRGWFVGHFIVYGDQESTTHGKRYRTQLSLPCVGRHRYKDSQCM